jgi:hypothetical protein
LSTSFIFCQVAWIAFVEAIRNSSESESEVCPYDDSVGTFFASVCAPGSKNRILGSENTDHLKNLCALCSEAYGGSSNSGCKWSVWRINYSNKINQNIY